MYDMSKRVSPAKVTKLEDSRLWVEQQILGLNVPMADPERMDVSQAPEQLVHVQLHGEEGRDKLQAQNNQALSITGMYFSQVKARDILSSFHTVSL